MQGGGGPTEKIKKGLNTTTALCAAMHDVVEDAVAEGTMADDDITQEGSVVEVSAHAVESLSQCIGVTVSANAVPPLGQYIGTMVCAHVVESLWQSIRMTPFCQYIAMTVHM